MLTEDCGASPSSRSCEAHASTMPAVITEMASSILVSRGLSWAM